MLIKSIRDILGGRPLFHVPTDTSVRAACTLMDARNIGAVAVLGAGGALAGILSERDVVRRGVARGLPLDSTPVAMIMTPDPVTVDIDEALSEALAAKIGGAFRHLPVMDNGAVAGILSFREIPTEYRMMFERFQDLTH
ncbi:CBS domain-containing protein [Actibacterium sp. D379-3]